MAVSILGLVLPYLAKWKCPACGAKTLRLVRPGLFKDSFGWICPCGYRCNSGVVVKTSWGVVAALLLFAALFATYMMVRFGGR